VEIAVSKKYCDPKEWN